MMVKQQFPMGIDSDRFFRALETPKVRECINELTEKFSGRQVGVVFHFSVALLFLPDTCQKYVLLHLFHGESHLGNLFVLRSHICSMSTPSRYDY